MDILGAVRQHILTIPGMTTFTVRPLAALSTDSPPYITTRCVSGEQGGNIETTESASSQTDFVDTVRINLWGTISGDNGVGYSALRTYADKIMTAFQGAKAAGTYTEDGVSIVVTYCDRTTRFPEIVDEASGYINFPIDIKIHYFRRP